jgi:hypothetical protein
MKGGYSLPKHTEDIVMKSIMELFKGDAVKFFGIDKKIVSVARTELSQIHVQKNIDDWVLYAEDDTYIHFEFQVTYNKDDLTRFMVSDAMLYLIEKKPVKTIVVYSSEIEDTITTLDTGAIQYNVEAFYMVKLDGDKAYADIKSKIDAGTPLVKQDLMSIVFLPLMKNSVDNETRLEQAISLSKAINVEEEQTQILAMLGLLVEKFVTDVDKLEKLKELLNVGKIFEMMRNDVTVEIAKSLLKNGVDINIIIKSTGLSESIIHELQEEIENEQ